MRKEYLRLTRPYTTKDRALFMAINLVASEHFADYHVLGQCEISSTRGRLTFGGVHFDEGFPTVREVSSMLEGMLASARISPACKSASVRLKLAPQESYLRELGFTDWSHTDEDLQLRLSITSDKILDEGNTFDIMHHGLDTDWLKKNRIPVKTTMEALNRWYDALDAELDKIMRGVEVIKPAR